MSGLYIKCTYKENFVNLSVIYVCLFQAENLLLDANMNIKIAGNTL